MCWFSTRTDVQPLPDFVDVGLAFVDDVKESDESVEFSLSIDEPWSWQVGLQVAGKLGCLPQLVTKATYSLNWETTTASVRGTTVELLLAVMLRVAPNIGERVRALVRDAQQQTARIRSLPPWCAPLVLSGRDAGAASGRSANCSTAGTIAFPRAPRWRSLGCGQVRAVGSVPRCSPASAHVQRDYG